jgi:hypothetical protein
MRVAPYPSKGRFTARFRTFARKRTLRLVRGRWRARRAEPANTRGGGSGDGDDGQGTRSSGGLAHFSASDNRRFAVAAPAHCFR